MIVNKNEEERIVTLPLLIPDYDDCDAPIGEKQLSEKEIADFAYKYMEKYRVVDGGHTYLQTKKEIATPVESWLLREDTAMKTIDNEEITYPKGTWMGSLKVFDDDAWDKVQKGEYTGGSVTVLEEAIADQIVAKEAAEKGRVLIKDIPDPAVATVALVDKPCVFGAKFCTIKSANKSSNSRDESYEGKRDKIRAALRKQYENSYIELTFDDKIIFHDWEEEKYYEMPYSINVEGVVELGTPTEVEKEFVAKKILEIAQKEAAEKAGRSISDSTYSKIKKAWESLGKLISKAENERENTSGVNKSDKMTDENKKENEYVKKEDFESFKSEIKEDIKNLPNSIKEAMETDEDKRNKKIASVKSELEELGIDTSKMDFSPKSDEDNEEDGTNEEEDNHSEKSIEEINGSSKSLDNHDVDNLDVSNKSETERIMNSMNETKKMITDQGK